MYGKSYKNALKIVDRLREHVNQICLSKPPGECFADQVFAYRMGDSVSIPGHYNGKFSLLFNIDRFLPIDLTQNKSVDHLLKTSPV